MNENAARQLELNVLEADIETKTGESPGVTNSAGFELEDSKKRRVDAAFAVV